MMIIEQAQLRECEAAIESALDNVSEQYVVVAENIEIIRSKKLYRDTHKTFEAYCQERWKHGRDWAYKAIEAARAAQKCIGSNTKPNLEQARKLAKAPPEKQAEVWQEASKNGKPTAAKVEQAVKKISGGLTFNVDELEDDETPIDIDELAQPYQQAGRDIDRIRRDMQAIADDPAVGGHLIDKITRITTACRELKATISQMEPAEVCGKCKGETCGNCASTGFWTKAIVQSRK